MHIPLRTRLLACGLVFAFAASSAARAESSLQVEWPENFGKISAATFDDKRVKVGKTSIEIERLDDGNVRLASDAGITDGAQTVMSALFMPIAEGKTLRPLYQSSRSFDEDRKPLGVLEIDHREAVGRCFKPDGTLNGELPLPKNDRVANMTLSLLLAPMVRDQQETLDFQLFFCGLGMRVVDFRAKLAPKSLKETDPRLREVTYGPSSAFANLVAPIFMPKLAFWFEAETPNRWMAHRLPLYGNGPEVIVIRDGVPIGWLGDD